MKCLADKLPKQTSSYSYYIHFTTKINCSVFLCSWLQSWSNSVQVASVLLYALPPGAEPLKGGGSQQLKRSPSSVWGQLVRFSGLSAPLSPSVSMQFRRLLTGNSLIWQGESEAQYSHRGLMAHSLYSPTCWGSCYLIKNPPIAQQ